MFTLDGINMKFQFLSNLTHCSRYDFSQYLWTKVGVQLSSLKSGAQLDDNLLLRVIMAKYTQRFVNDKKSLYDFAYYAKIHILTNK